MAAHQCASVGVQQQHSQCSEDKSYTIRHCDLVKFEQCLFEKTKKSNKKNKKKKRTCILIHNENNVEKKKKRTKKKKKKKMKKIEKQ